MPDCVIDQTTPFGPRSIASVMARIMKKLIAPKRSWVAATVAKIETGKSGAGGCRWFHIGRTARLMPIETSAE